MKQEVLQDIACLAQMRSGGQEWRDDCLQAIEEIKKGTFDADLEEFGQDSADLETVSDYVLQRCLNHRSWYVYTLKPGYQKIHQPYPPLFNLLTKQWKLIHFYTFQLWDQMVRQCHRYKDGTSE